jgi:hypothetical protein
MHLHHFLENFRLALVLIAAAAIGMYLKSTFKFIRDFPQPGNFKWHIDRWEKTNYDHYLDPRVDIVRHALSIDETRSDFARVEWGPRAGANRPRTDQQLEQFEQIWFAGNHSDIGGSYAENDSRLSDIALQWMLSEVTAIQHPILIDSSHLHLFPDLAGEQHCEVTMFKDKYWSWWPERLKFSWPVALRNIPNNAPLHPSVYRRFELPAVLDCGYWEPYRPEALRQHADLAKFYVT